MDIVTSLDDILTINICTFILILVFGIVSLIIFFTLENTEERMRLQMEFKNRIQHLDNKLKTRINNIENIIDALCCVINIEGNIHEANKMN